MRLIATTVIAALSFRTTMFIVNGIALVALLVAFLFTLRGRTPATAPNLAPYYDDDVMEGAKLERVLGWALVFSAVLAASLPIYWLVEPNRQTSMVRQFDKESVERGSRLFAPAGTFLESLGCAGCHGDKGTGGAAAFALPGPPPRQVAWKAPALNTVLLRFPIDQVKSIITYGRPGTPMPPWGLAGGGALNDQSIDDLANYLASIQLTSKKAMAQQANILDGKTLFDNNCARCHTKGFSYGEPDVQGGGAFGPNLTNGDTLRQFPDIKDQIDFITNGSLFQKPYGVRGIGSGRMPGFGRESLPDAHGKTTSLRLLTDEQIRAIAEYERKL